MPDVTINHPLADLIFRKCGLKEQQAVRVAEVLLGEGVTLPTEPAEGRELPPWHGGDEEAYRRKGEQAIWNAVQELAPWAESNDMDWCDEILCGLAGVREQIAAYERRPWPGCQILSKGDACDCSLCKADRANTALRSQLAGVQGALMDAGDVLAIRTDGDYGASVREVVEQRDALCARLKDSNAMLNSAAKWIAAAEAIGKAAGYEHAESEISPEYFAEKVVELITALREQVTRMEHELRQSDASTDNWRAACGKAVTLKTDYWKALQRIAAIVGYEASGEDAATKAIGISQAVQSALTARDEEVRRLRDALQNARTYVGRAWTNCPLHSANEKGLHEALQIIDAALASPPRTYVGDGKPLPKGVWLHRLSNGAAEGPYIGLQHKGVPGKVYTFVGPVPSEE